MRPLLACLLAAAGLSACDGERSTPRSDHPDELVVGVLMPLPPSGVHIDLAWAVENVNAGGGILGDVPLRLRAVDTNGRSREEVVALAQLLADDPQVLAVIGPGSSDEMLDVAAIMVQARKPLVSFTATSGDVLRAFRGSKYVWRTKLTDTAQVEWLVREARRLGARRVGLVTSAGAAGSTFFNWFPFLAVSEGYAEEDVVVEVYGEGRPCAEATQAILAAGVDRIIAVPDSPPAFECFVGAYGAARAPRPGMPPPPVRMVVADTGLETNKPIAMAGPRAVGLEGWNAAPDPDSGFSDAWRARFGVGHPNNGASAYDAVLLIALGLERSGGQGGEALADAMKAVVAGRGAPVSWDAAGLATALSLIRAGESPDVTGATGPLEYDPEVGVDLVTGTFAHWIVRPPLAYDRTARIGAGDEPPPAPDRRPGAADFVPPPTGAGFAPAGPPRRLNALIVAASSGWDNYRHQADALRQYQRLRAAGVADDDIVMIGADDLATSPENRAPGVVRNVAGGPDVRAGAVYDYDGSAKVETLKRVLLGAASPTTPAVLDTDADTNLLVFLVGHGGATGLGLGAETTEAGVVGGGAERTFSPSDLREALCTLRRDGRLRRALVVVESCYSGVFGDAEYGGVEAGCPDGLPLEGVLVLAAANTRETSLAAAYDPQLRAWVGDEFALSYAERLEQGDRPSLLGMYRDVYLDVSGSHASVYNAEAYGDLDAHFADEFYTRP